MIVMIDIIMNARRRAVKPLGASRSLSEYFPCTGYIIRQFLMKEKL